MPSWVWIAVFSCAAALCLIGIVSAKKQKPTAHRQMMLAMLVAVYFVLSVTLSINLYWIRISLDPLPILLATLLYGPLGGMTVGLLGSFLNQLLTYGLTPTTILWMLPAVLRGASVGLMLGRGQPSRARLTAAIVVSSLLVTALNTLVMYIDSVVNGYYSYAYVFGGLVTRVVSGVLTALVLSVIVPPLVALLRRTLPEAAEAKQ